LWRTGINFVLCLCTILVTPKEKFPADFTSKEKASSNINGKNIEKNIKADMAL
jgi:hypothetical protein